ncbi:MAG: hypothetical protein LC730_07220 [Acidobacteria bacterium]|nr:hypothetical protein [Acidobacteriota bacterium]MCA1609228.1 hypothetical protein [Acidobacteriota bacterium]
MRKLHFAFLILAFSTAGLSQQPDRWRGLVIDESTPEHAVNILGQPASDKTGNRLFLNNAKWLKKDTAKSLRVMHYENVQGFGDVKLGFDGTNKLKLIHLEPKKLTAQAFVSSYSDLEFRFGNEVMSPADLKRPPDNLERPRRMGVVYLLVAATDQVFVFGQAGNATGNVMSNLLGNAESRQAGRSMPGDIAVIQLVSRTLENKDGADLLK